MSTAVGIHFGESSSSIAYINSHGQPMTIPDKHGSPVTPTLAVVDDAGHIFAGTTAADYLQLHSHRVLTDFRSFLGSSDKYWTNWQNQKLWLVFTPMDAARELFAELLSVARNQIGTVEEAAITVPHCFSESQRQAVIEAGQQAGLKRAVVVEEPVALALTYMFSSECLWFTELAEQQRLLVVQLERSALNLAIVHHASAEIRVIASNCDLDLGGNAWKCTLLDTIADQFAREFKVDPRHDPLSLQFLALEVENAINSLTVRPKTALTCQHAGHRKSYQVEQPQFEKLTQGLVDRVCELTQSLLKDNRMGWAHVDVILLAGEFSKMPGIRNALKQMGGRTLITSLSSDHAMSYGAAHYAAMQNIVRRRLPQMSTGGLPAEAFSCQTEKQTNHNSFFESPSFVDEVDLCVSQMDALRIVPSLNRLVRMRGAAAICQPAMLKGWLMDHVPDRRRDILLLTQSLEADVPARLVEQYREGAGTFQREVLSSRMVSEFGIQPALADEVVEIWSRVIRDLINANSLESLSLSTESKSRSLWSVMNRPSQAGSAEVW